MHYFTTKLTIMTVSFLKEQIMQKKKASLLLTHPLPTKCK